LPLGARPPLLATPQLLSGGEPDSREHHRQQHNPVVLFAEAEVLSGQQAMPAAAAWTSSNRARPAVLLLLADRAADRLFELLEHSDACRSWFVGNRLLPASSAALIATEMDPVFPLLPLLLKDLRYRRLTRPVIATSSRTLACCCSALHAQLPGRLADSVCDVRPSISSSSSLPLVRLNLDRCLGWLEAKLRRIAAGLRDSGIDLDDAPVDEETASARRRRESGRFWQAQSSREKQEPLENYALLQEQQAPVKAVGTRKPALRKEAGMQSITNFFAKRN
uniref:Ydr279_N domain-containing protein n=1 Tax=Macrostomum lignano TaxID=282301 RepID=A0A1I8FK69_9PLAT